MVSDWLCQLMLAADPTARSGQLHRQVHVSSRRPHSLPTATKQHRVLLHCVVCSWLLLLGSM